MNVRQLFLKLSPEQRALFGVSSLNLKNLGLENSYWQTSHPVECPVCGGPCKKETRFELTCVNECWRLEFSNLTTKQKNLLEAFLKESISLNY